EASRRARYERYFEQVVCVFGRITAMLERIEAAGRRKNAVIVIHGDYGSRISLADKDRSPRKISQRDLVDLHATFFSVRSRHTAAGLDGEFISLQRLFA